MDQQHETANAAGTQRRGLLKCMAWAGTGLLWTVSGGVPRSALLGGGAMAATGELTFMQISDSHIGFKVEPRLASAIAGVRIQEPQAAASIPALDASFDEGEAFVCRCERVSLAGIVDFIKANQVRDINQLKTLRVGMGACGGKTCSQLLGKAFRLAGVDPDLVEPGSLRPLTLEVPMGELVNEGLIRLGGKEAGARGAI